MLDLLVLHLEQTEQKLALTLALLELLLQAGSMKVEMLVQAGLMKLPVWEERWHLVCLKLLLRWQLLPLA